MALLGRPVRTDAGGTEESRDGAIQHNRRRLEMTKTQKIGDSAKFLTVAGSELVVAAVIGAAMIVEVAVAKTVLTPLFRKPTSHTA